MGRIINTETAGKERAQLSKAVLVSTRELMKQTEVNSKTRDLAAFIALTLESMAKTIDSSVLAWEKRGYWVKAERFRMEWAWADKYSQKMRSALIAEDWGNVAQSAVKVAEKLQKIKIPQRNTIGEPWTGAWIQLLQSENQELPKS